LSVIEVFYGFGDLRIAVAERTHTNPVSHKEISMKHSTTTGIRTANTVDTIPSPSGEIVLLGNAKTLILGRPGKRNKDGKYFYTK